jgi:hypothetical protein
MLKILFESLKVNGEIIIDCQAIQVFDDDDDDDDDDDVINNDENVENYNNNTNLNNSDNNSSNVHINNSSPKKIKNKNNITTKPKIKAKKLKNSELPLCLFPTKTYCGATGIWFLPTRACLFNWLKRCQFKEIECFYDEKLSCDEQRSTEWAEIKSLKDFLMTENDQNSDNNNDNNSSSNNNKIKIEKTIEGYPQPRRMYFKAKKF